MTNKDVSKKIDKTIELLKKYQDVLTNGTEAAYTRIDLVLTGVIEGVEVNEKISWAHIRNIKSSHGTTTPERWIPA
jgi:hypothetical protein